MWAPGYGSGVILSAIDARRIAEGRKTQLRLPAPRRAPDPGSVVPITFHEQVEFSHRQVAVRACHVFIVERWRTRLYLVTEDEAIACGHHHRDEMLDVWERRDQVVWALRFELRDAHRPRLLSSQVIAGRQGAYVDNAQRALPDEPEAVDRQSQSRITEEANALDYHRRVKLWRERAELPFVEQLSGLKEEARARHIDIRSELRAIEKWTGSEARRRQLQRIREKLEHPMLVSAVDVG